MPPASSAPSSLPLTVFDLFWLRFSPSQRLFFYELPPHLGTTAAFSQTVLPKLRQSLSLTPQTWTLLARNLAWPQSSDKPLIQYSEGDALSLTVAESGADFHHLSDKSSFREATEYRSHLPDLPSSHARVPVLALQVTRFPNSVFSVGHSAHHAVVGGKTLTAFMTAWASICSSSNSMADQPLYGRAFLSDDQERAMLSLHGMRGGEKAQLMFAADCRARLDPPEPSTYFGNSVVGCCATADVDGLLGEDGVAMAAKVIGEAIDDLKHADLKAAQDLIFGRASTPTSLDNVFTIAGSPRFEFYKVDFGWGRPRKVEVISIDRTGVSLFQIPGMAQPLLRLDSLRKKTKLQILLLCLLVALKLLQGHRSCITI
ncbi:BAHD acyltransferase DCR-like [Diospyros lotus]|uniref:BAHD acyltransferase DCR-like n=1 Tax=Diospyros lotus TaxID=55363 RepID=UPI00225B6DE8|nr:BAHD acyltransferase DCR-like [Diospyros lotus]